MASSEHPAKAGSHESGRRAYEPPRIVAYDEGELLRRIGPAVACARWTVTSPPGDEPNEPENAPIDW